MNGKHSFHMRNQKNQNKKKPHSPNGKIVGYCYCIRCGLVYLRNIATERAIKDPCPGFEEEE